MSSRMYRDDRGDIQLKYERPRASQHLITQREHRTDLIVCFVFGFAAGALVGLIGYGVVFG